MDARGPLRSVQDAAVWDPAFAKVRTPRRALLVARPRPACTLDLAPAATDGCAAPRRAQYLRELGCPLTPDGGSNNTQLLEWLLGWALQLEYADDGAPAPSPPLAPQTLAAAS